MAWNWFGQYLLPVFTKGNNDFNIFAISYTNT